MEPPAPSPPRPPDAQQQQQQRPRWFDPERTHPLSSRIPLATSNLPATADLTRGWMRFQITADNTPAGHDDDSGHHLYITESGRMTRDQYQTTEKETRSRKRPKLGLCQKTKGVPRRVFSLRLAPTKEQKLYFQRAFGIACLAKRLAYKYLGDQRVEMDTPLMEDLRTRICTENRQTHVYPPGVERTAKQKGGYKIVSRPNDFLPDKYRERLFETHLYQMDANARKFFDSRQSNGARVRGRANRLRVQNWTIPLWRRPVPSDVRNNAVLQFCRAVASTQAQTQERQVSWDAKMAAHQKFLLHNEQQQTNNRELDVSLVSDTKNNNNVKKKKRGRTKNNDEDASSTAVGSKYPPRGERPEMGARQVKPPDRNDPVQCFQIDARSTNMNPYSASWLNGDDCVRFMGINVMLWGSPSRRRRELNRLTSFMPQGERGTHQQVTVKYDHGRYYLQVQRLLLNVNTPKPHLPTEPARIVALDPGIRTFHGIADSEGRFGEIGEAQVERLVRVAKKADRIQSQIDTRLQGHDQKGKRKRARRRLRRHHVKCRDLKNDGHWKVASALCKRYDDILIPKFHCGAMKRCLAKTTTRQLNLWSHYQFRQRLKHKAEELGVRVHETAEPQTSITCTRCLWIEDAFRNNAAKRFVCRGCGFEVDRDRNGARNILLRNVERHVGRVKLATTGAEQQQ